MTANVDPFSDGQAEVGSQSSIPLFLIGQIVAHLATWLALLAIPTEGLRTPRNNAESIISIFFYQDISDPRKVMVVAGFLVVVVFFNLFLVYLNEFITDIWNPFYAKEGDSKKFSYFMIYYAAQYIAVSFYPNGWWIVAPVSFYGFVAFLGARIHFIKDSLAKSSYILKENGVFFDVYEENEGIKELNENLTAKLYALIAIRRNFRFKGSVYGGIIIAIAGACHIARHFADSNTARLLAGAYLAASLIFVLFAVANIVIRSKYTLPAMQGRILAGDFEYFRIIAR
ncbi:hypothetical protein [Rhizobium leguminosarum]|uniref:Transmembrane protein n=1 Tax=Rhizobium leguminosarum TaxID=384 RepID=A0A7K3VD28_RHILE|nr:hypothetical protein [Rhizobium leguminosarum]NEK15045.1 hypothetical protein [Rhizobium leguminosarum]